VLNESYREVLVAIATCAAGLTGLLFVAISVAPREGRTRQPHIIQQVRAASALVAFINALSVSLFGLVPGSSAGQAALALALIGILFTAASVRSVLASPDVTPKQRWRQAGLIATLLAAFGAELGCGIGLISNNTGTFGPGLLCDVLIAMLLIGIARAWELVGDRDTGILSSLAVIVGHSPTLYDPADPSGETGIGNGPGAETDNGTGR
jgi:hypothetical protein